ncbi:FadR/GntR family transcriptional regulator [Paenibacillus flagellatus]|uniref:FadR family transcriptional regulator n=1 Tax=Paenibacillus flagellatus TaxID=2211139 RepID=A0A2V5K6F6_9BACL|nr:FadR/GntR family transcriptional regulator [Paenibacillus flagellatus]PYI54989.1 FadR family transcriptional regulator [Paenibacillus flagellatus]
MSFNQVKPLKGYELVKEQIKARIDSGELAPGAKLASVVELAATFGVGRSTIREALSALKAIGFVEIRQGGGTYVSAELPKEPPAAGGTALFANAQSIRELLEVRKILETGCASLAARNRTEDDMRSIGDELALMEAHLHDEAKGEEADVRFHLKLAAATHNSLLIQMMESMSQRLHDSMKESRRLWFYGERAEARRLLREHSDIYEAVKARDETAAFEAMMTHLGKVEAVLRKAIADADH